jgi:TRAP-type C4-dicarboxylate transport system substrate-binding protein
MIAAAAFAAGVLSSASAWSQTEINASIWFPDTHPLTKYGYLDWAKRVEAESKGQLKIKVFTGTALLPPNAHLSGLRDGIAQITYHAGTYTPADLPEDNVIAILGIGLKNNIVTAAAVSDFYLNDPAMQDMFRRHKIVFLGSYATPPYVLMCRPKIETLADIKGKKIRMPGAVHAEWAKAVGAVPVNVASSEMFTGLEKGQLDCAANAANDMKSRSLWDVAKNVTDIDLGSYFAGWQHAIHAPTWQKLKPEQRRVLLDTISDAMIETAMGYTADSQAAMAEAPSKGVAITKPAADLQKALDDFVATTAREMAIKEGKERFKLKDPEGLVQRFEATRAKWSELFAKVDMKDQAAMKKVLRDNLYGKVDVNAYGS